MTTRSSTQIRQEFIDFFREKCGHTYVPSSPVVPLDDPTLLFTNAGMNQFKDVFLGVGTREYNRAANTQKCIRAGGKHNDLDDVGKDTYHHTFFEMLGNWSFGDYFKKEAIEWAWQLLTEVWGLDKSRLHATVFEGDPALGLEPDNEAIELWKTVTDIDHANIHKCSAKDNFWEMGDTGPCGPCSEIHIDLTDDLSGRDLVNMDDPRVIEIWNLVFIQFNRNPDQSLTPLPAKHVDTGMGFERISAVLQGKGSNYDTDVFTPIFDAIREITGARAYGGSLEDPIDMAYRVIADHIRTLTFSITDGARPDNEGRNYVVRRVLRRAVRYGRQMLGMEEPFLYRLVSSVVNLMGDVFPELKAAEEAVTNDIRTEEEHFNRTLGRGIELFDQAAKRGGNAISGEDAFELYTTFGFPLDLTELMAEERNMTVDTDGFNTQMDKHRDVSRGADNKSRAGESLVTIVQQASPPETAFVGYDRMVEDSSTLQAIYVLQNDEYVAADDVQEDQPAALVVSSTPFYAEAGGQVGDTGYIRSLEGSVFRVDDTIKVGGVYFHLGELEEGNIHEDKPAFSVETSVLLEVNHDRRRHIMRHHTTTHLMNLALRAKLGEHVMQRGSLVDDTRLRFDFCHDHSMNGDQVAEVESIVNNIIEQDMPVNADEADQQAALGVHGLRAVFGEKYPPRVRVVSIGPTVEELLADPDNRVWTQYSIEFCGGTHLESTGDADSFVIVSEEAVAKGIRRITAMAGEPAKRVREDGEALIGQLESLKESQGSSLESGVSELADNMNHRVIALTTREKIQAGLSELQAAVKEQKKAKGKQAESAVVETARQIADTATGNVIVTDVAGADGKTLLKAMDVIRGKNPDAGILLAAVSGDKIAFVASVPKPMIGQGLKAGDWVREVARVAGGGGGGRPDMAQAGGKDPAKLPDALKRGQEFADEAIG